MVNVVSVKSGTILNIILVILVFLSDNINVWKQILRFREVLV